VGVAAKLTPHTRGCVTSMLLSALQRVQALDLRTAAGPPQKPQGARQKLVEGILQSVPSCETTRITAPVPCTTKACAGAAA
jgi:hypothetical protein